MRIHIHRDGSCSSRCEKKAKENGLAVLIVLHFKEDGTKIIWVSEKLAHKPGSGTIHNM
jgi:hypothetical protein